MKILFKLSWYMADIKKEKVEANFDQIQTPESAAEAKSVKTPEVEKTSEASLEKLSESITEQAASLPVEQIGEGGLVGVTQVKQRLQKRQKDIENILAEDMEDIFLSLPPEKQQEFKKEGEEVAKKINLLMEAAKISFKKIVNLIRKWLMLIPRVNKFFLEQEAKIKADEIVRIKKEEGK
jgi:hypothetical protein